MGHRRLVRLRGRSGVRGGGVSLDDLPDAAVIAEFRARLLAGRFGDRELLMPADRDYSGMWSALCKRLIGWENRFGRDHPVIAEIRQAMFALNTTEYGRERS
jgi:hypothetical protein